MLLQQPFSPSDTPRHPHQEIVDLLATAFLRLRQSAMSSADDRSVVDLGFGDQQRVHANPSQDQGVR